MHSLKDVPTALPSGLLLRAILERADARDVLVSAGAAARGAAARAPASAPRASGAARSSPRCAPSSRLEDLRGNVDTRLRRLREGRFDAILLAMAGLARLGRAGEATEILDPARFVPAPGQGAIALECREDDAAVRAAVAPLDHPPTARAVAAERAFLAGSAAAATCRSGRTRSRRARSSSSWRSSRRRTEARCCARSAGAATRWRSAARLPTSCSRGARAR